LEEAWGWKTRKEDLVEKSAEKRLHRKASSRLEGSTICDTE